MFNSHNRAPDPETDPSRQAAGVVIKPPLGDESDIRGREARCLERLRHPGIVELIDAVAGPDGTTLHLAQVPSAVTLDDAGSLSLSELLDVAKQLAEAIAYLQSTGTVHNAVTTDHVLLGDHNRLVLCGFGDWAELSDTNTCTDVVAFGDLVLGQLELSIASGAVDSDNSVAISLRHLGQLAANCPLTETSAQSLADRLELLQAETTESDAARSALSDTVQAVGRIAGGVLIGVLVVGFAWLILRPGPNTSTRQATEIVAPTAPETTPTRPITDPQPTPIQGAMPPAGELVAATAPQCTAGSSAWEELPDVRWIDLDGDMCLDPWRYENGVLHTSEGRFAVGGPGDSFTLGDWNCDGVATPAVASGGLLYRFDTAPYSIELGSQAVGEVIAGTPAIVSVETRTNAECDELVVTDFRGETSVIAGPQLEVSQ